MKNYLLLLFTTISLAVNAQCLEITSIFVDACGPTEGENEMFTFETGALLLNISNITVDWPNNSFLGWCQDAGTASSTAALNSTITTSCGFLLEPPGGIVPPNSNVLVITSTNISILDNSFEGLSDTMYIVYQCAGNTAGHFANSGTGNRTLTVSVSGSCISTTSAIYNRSLLVGGDGATVLFDAVGNATYVNNGCNAPVVTINPFWSFTSAICNNYGNVDLNTLLSPTATTGGTWSGLGVTGSNFNPSGILGTTSITYSVSPSGNCTETSDSTIVFSVDTTPTVTDLVQSCDSAFVNGTWYSADAFVTFTSPGISPYGCNTLNEITVDITGSIIDSSYFFSCDSVLFNGIWYTSSIELRDTVVGIPSTPGSSCNELFISEYGEGSSFNKYIEIYNGTDAPVDLSTYSINVFFNGAATPGAGSPINLNSVILLPGQTYVIVSNNSNVNPALQALADQFAAGINFNGDDAVGLYNNGILIDLIGNIGCDPGTQWSNGTLSTLDNSIIRNPDYTIGVTVSPTNPPCDFPTLTNLNWTALGNDNWSNVGTHTANCGGLATGGCDTIFITTIEIAPAAQLNTINLCTNIPAEVGTLNDTIQSSTGCDSLITSTVTTLVLTTQNITQACTNNPTNVGLDTTSVILSALGCDSIYLVTNTTLVTPTQNITQACTNNPANVGIDTTSVILSTLGCDSIYLVTNTTLVTPIQNIIQVCTNIPAEAGQVTTSIILSSLGCDSIINITNTTLITPTQNITQLCTNNPTEVGQVTTSVIQSVLGCDSVINITNTILVTPTQSITQACTNIPANVGSVTTSIIQSTLGCDSIINITNTTLATPTQISTTNCTNIPVEAGTFTTIIPNSFGCDSIINNLTVNLITPITETTSTQCTNIAANAGLAITDTLQSLQGCDSVYFAINTILIELETTSITLSGCDSVVWDGITYFNNFTTTDTILSDLGCDSIVNSLSITVEETPTANAGEDVTILLGESTTLSAIEGINYEWNWTGNSSESQTIEVSPNESTLYIVTVSNGNCFDTDSVFVTVINRVTEIFIPDAFTPNGDGINDIFEVVNAQDFDNILLRVFNRWGELIHEGNGQNHGWNGVYKGELQNVGVYVYYVSANNRLNGLPLIDKGSVSLIR